MKYNTYDLLQQLQADVRELILAAAEWQQQPTALLHVKPGAAQWSVAQVLEHLNLYTRHYVPAIENVLHLHGTKPDAGFRPGWLGNYFTKLMKPVNGKAPSKMKAPKNGQPSDNPDAEKMLAEFLNHQYQLLTLLAVAESANLSRLRVPTSLHPRIRLKLGDTFRFFIAHEQRHCLQIKRTLNLVKDFAYEKA